MKTPAPLPLPVYSVEVIKGTKREEVTAQVSQHFEEPNMSIRSRMWEKHEVNLSPVARRALSVALLLTLSFVAVAQEPPASSTGAGPGSWPRSQLIRP